MPPTARTRKRKDTGPGWTAPGEKDTLVGFIDYLRNAIMDKVSGVPSPRSAPPACPPAPTSSG